MWNDDPIEDIAASFWKAACHYDKQAVIPVQKIPEPPADFNVRRIHEDYDGEKCSYCQRMYPFPVAMHHTREECEFWESRL